MVFPNDSHISDKVPCKSEGNMLNESNHDQKPDAVFIDADFSDDPLHSDDILNKFEENISKEPNPDDKLVQCEALVLNDFDLDYNSDDLISIVVYPYHEVTSHVYSSQCEKYVLNGATSFITWRYEDPTLCCGGG
ncbi:unnamed protein product [Schistosoma mattheei]|uniref:Uncharacterized protein n=1 Tax=Schistosoma mattheei TaxID=31246 RepID=A0A183NI09_9TREM|nr:unnamed protein product [Schistosoma mattheei]